MAYNKKISSKENKPKPIQTKVSQSADGFIEDQFNSVTSDEKQFADEANPNVAVENVTPSAEEQPPISEAEHPSGTEKATSFNPVEQTKVSASATKQIVLPTLGAGRIQPLGSSLFPITLNIDSLTSNKKGIEIIGALHDPEHHVNQLGVLISHNTKAYIPLDSSFPGVVLKITERPDLTEHFGLPDGVVPQGFVAQLPCRLANDVAELVLVLEEGGTLVTQCTRVDAIEIRGYFERCDATGIIGWVMSDNADKPLQIEILANGYPIAHIMADGFRGDLLQDGIGDGKHGFTVMPPGWLFDGNEHMIEIRELSTGFVLTDSPKFFQANTSKRDEIALNGSAIVGWAKLPGEVNADVTLNVLDGEKIISVGHGEFYSEGIRFHLPLPASVFDGRPHLFSVRSNDPALVIGDLPVITPYMATPLSVLQQYAREGLKPALSTAAGFRYDSLLGAITKLAEESPNTHLPDNVAMPVVEQIAQLVRAHAQLVRGFSENDKIFPPLTFPEITNPRVSIVIPVHNKFPVTYHCLASLLVAANHASFEVIVVDDGSKDVSTRIPEWIKGIQYIRNDEAQGFIRACNLGGTLARGEYIVMLNNDTEVTAHWLDELLWTFEHFDKVGMAGAKLLYPDGTLQEAGGIVWNTGDPWNYGRQANPHDTRYIYARQVDYLSGACIMLPRTLWNELGGFDEAFVPAYFEDADLAFRVRDKGYKTVYTPFSQAIHFEGISSGTSTASGIKQYQEINRPKFKRRWAGVCRNNGDVGVNLDIHKDRNVEIRALVLDAETPMPDKNAGSYAAIQEMRMLQALGFKCTFAPLNMAWMGRYTEELQRMGVECLYAPFTCSFNEILEKRGEEFDIVYITRYYVAQQYIDAIRQYAPQAKIVLMNADLHFLRELRMAIEHNDQEEMSRALETRGNELLTMREVDLVLVYTDVEKAVILTHNLSTTNVAKCPWVTDVVNDNEVPNFDARIDIAFLGGFNHHPNVQAVEWFAEKVMPLLRGVLPSVKFRVYGSNMPNSLLTLAEKDDSIVIEGWVPTVDKVYNTCRVFIAPLQSGAGIKGKVIGAMAHGVPCVLSTIAAEGIAQGSVVDKPEEWVSAIANLYQNPQTWADASRQVLAFSRNQYGFDKGVAQMQEALQQAEIFTTIHNNALVMR